MSNTHNFPHLPVQVMCTSNSTFFLFVLQKFLFLVQSIIDMAGSQPHTNRLKQSKRISYKHRQKKKKENCDKIYVNLLKQNMRPDETHLFYFVLKITHKIKATTATFQYGGSIFKREQRRLKEIFQESVILKYRLLDFKNICSMCNPKHNIQALALKKKKYL